MKNRILVAIISLSAGVLITLSLFGLNGSNQDTQPELCVSKEIPKDYCDPSIKALEEELAVSFRINRSCKSKIETCEEKLGLSKSDTLEQLKVCEKSRALWNKRAEQVKLVFFACQQEIFSLNEVANEQKQTIEQYSLNYNICSEELENCSNILNSCIECAEGMVDSPAGGQ